MCNVPVWASTLASTSDNAITSPVLPLSPF